eukprot:CAMPEP_0113936718 /NCGR_PEP_ID=MMETSP1339-20121228/3543_1 /TAXON_ID=94617 /ORGANISM="Fibrocapsa japonica" /LENGTH=358 /DNA_ID=CAMNT_0000939259 /DNA_START=227 /DNA_END=1303 /DNA_ORIENTATION=- /assembly_acc=CAM_ASM_000762
MFSMTGVILCTIVFSFSNFYIAFDYDFSGFARDWLVPLSFSLGGGFMVFGLMNISTLWIELALQVSPGSWQYGLKGLKVFNGLLGLSFVICKLLIYSVTKVFGLAFAITPLYVLGMYASFPVASNKICPVLQCAPNATRSITMIASTAQTMAIVGVITFFAYAAIFIFSYMPAQGALLSTAINVNFLGVVLTTDAIQRYLSNEAQLLEYVCPCWLYKVATTTDEHIAVTSSSKRTWWDANRMMLGERSHESRHPSKENNESKLSDAADIVTNVTGQNSYCRNAWESSSTKPSPKSWADSINISAPRTNGGNAELEMENPQQLPNCTYDHNVRMAQQPTCQLELPNAARKSNSRLVYPI